MPRSKSFLVLFFKKEHLPSYTNVSSTGVFPADVNFPAVSPPAPLDPPAW
jgi:hypothetical protein